MPDPILLPPDAARTSQGLRDTGYDPSDALEDVVDNSIAAGATLVNIRVWLDPAGDLTITIADNGSGMNEAGLINAMTYGSAVRQNNLCYNLDHLVSVLAQLLDRIGDLDLIDSWLNEECSAAFRFFLFV